jgi:glycosyltransferase involved in cell wall biosynthesis
MNTKTPRVSIGMPVYQGERFLGEAIESLLGQTFADFELIISDNASTDKTGTICRRFAARDPRIRYYRANINHGVCWNYRRVARLARCEYFKWCACDDICAPTFLERCVDVLDRHPDVMWCHPQTAFIDAFGKPTLGPTGAVFSCRSPSGKASHDPALRCGPVRSRPTRESTEPHERFAAVLLARAVYDHYGLIRMSALRRTGQERPFFGSDKVLMAELSLIGRFTEIPEVLLFWRHHDEQSGMRRFLQAHRVASGQWNKKLFIPRRLHCTYWYVRLILGSDISRDQKVRCFTWLIRCVAQPERWRLMALDALGALGIERVLSKPLHRTERAK